MKLSTGKIAFPIEFDNGDKETIYFNPTDPDLPIRFKAFQENVMRRIKDIDDMALSANGTPTDGKYIEMFEKARNIVCEEMDTAFASPVSASIFKHCSPFAIVDGEYFILQFLMAIRPEIEKHVKQANADVEKHIGKYALSRVKHAIKTANDAIEEDCK